MYKTSYINVSSIWIAQLILTCAGADEKGEVFHENVMVVEGKMI